MSTVISRLYSWVTDKTNNVKIIASRMVAENNQIITALNRKVLCATSAPSSPIAGQTWSDTTNKILKLYRNNEWVGQGAIHIGVSAPATPQEGDIWWDSTNNILYVYDGSNQKQIYPASISSGMIMMWSGSIATIPAGWVLCNGSNSTPDLRDKFIVGAKQDDSGTAKTNITGSLTQSGGSTTITQANLPSYNLTVTASAANGSGLNRLQGTTNGQGDNNYDIPSGGSGTAYTQPYYALAFIMKT